MTYKQLASIAVTFIVYTMMLSWKTALLFVVGIGWHEYSHILAAKKIGIKTGGFYMVPFVGGAALLYGQYKDYNQQVFVALMGPVGGAVLAIISLICYWVTGYPWLVTTTYWIAAFNLFNLLPISFLDGGQLMDTLTYSHSRRTGLIAKTISTVIGTVLLVFINPLIALIVGSFGGILIGREYSQYKWWKNGDNALVEERYLNLPLRLRNLQKLNLIYEYVTVVLVLSAIVYAFNSNPNSSITFLISK